MRQLDRYIRAHVVMAMLLVLLVLTGLDFIFTLFDEAGGSGDDGYGTMDALRYVVLTLPRHVYELLPLTALIGALLGLGALASNNELVVMQSAGVKTLRIVWAVMKPAILVMVLGLFLGEFVAPPLELRAELGKAMASGEQNVLSRYGSWLREDDRYMHFNALDPDGVLHGVTLYDYDGQRRLMANTYAERAVYEGEGNWRLEEVSETRFLREDGALLSKNRRVGSLLLDMEFTPELLRVQIVEPDRMAVSELWRYAGYYGAQEQDASPYYLALWKKLLQPLTTAVLVLVAISFIFGPLRSSTVGARVFTAISFGLLFVILQRLLSTVSLVYQLDPLAAVVLPIALSAMIGLHLLRRAA